MSTPLVEAAKHGRAAELEQLLGLGASVNERDSETAGSALFWASCSGSCESVRVLLEAGCEVNAANVHGHSPLHAAADRGYTKVVQDLLDSRATVNARNSEGLTPLHLAAYRGYSAIVDLLLRSGADLQVRSNDNKTALHEALAQKQFSVVEAMSYFDRRAPTTCEVDFVRRRDSVTDACSRHQPHNAAKSPSGDTFCQKDRPKLLPSQPLQLKKTISSPPSTLTEGQAIHGRSKVRPESLPEEGVTVLLHAGQKLPSSFADVMPLYPRQPGSAAAAGRAVAEGAASALDQSGDAATGPLSPIRLLHCWSGDLQARGNGRELNRAQPMSPGQLDSHLSGKHRAMPVNGHSTATSERADSSCSVQRVSLPHDSALVDPEGQTTDDGASDEASHSIEVSPADLAKTIPGHLGCDAAAAAGDRSMLANAQALSASSTCSVPHQMSRSWSLNSEHTDGSRQQQQQQSVAPLLRRESDGSMDGSGRASRPRQLPVPKPRGLQGLAAASSLPRVTGRHAPDALHPPATACLGTPVAAEETEPPAAALEQNSNVAYSMTEAAMCSWMPGVHYTLVDSEPFSFVRQRGGSRRLLFRIASVLSVAYTLKVVLDSDCDLFPLNLRLLSPAARVGLVSSDFASQLASLPRHRHVARVLASYCGDGSYFARTVAVMDSALPVSQQHGSGVAAHGRAQQQRGVRTHAATVVDAQLSTRAVERLGTRWLPASHATAAMFYVMPGSYTHTLGSFMRWRRATWPVPPYGIEAGTYLRLAYEMLSAAVHLRQAANLCHCAVTPEAVYVTADVHVAVGDVEACTRLWAVDGSRITYSEESLVQSSCSRNVDYEWWPPELERHILLSCHGRPPEHPIYAHVLHEKSDSYSIGRTMYAIMAAQGRDTKGCGSTSIIFPVISRAKLHYRDDEVPDVTDGWRSDCYPWSLRDLLCSLVRDVCSRPTAIDALTRVEKELSQLLPAAPSV